MRRIGCTSSVAADGAGSSTGAVSGRTSLSSCRSSPTSERRSSTERSTAGRHPWSSRTMGWILPIWDDMPLIAAVRSAKALLVASMAVVLPRRVWMIEGNRPARVEVVGGKAADTKCYAPTR